MRLNARHHGARVFQLVLLVSVLVAGTVSFAAASRADSTHLDTTSSWNGTRTLGPFGYPNTSTYGQTVTAPATDTQLTSFSFYMSLPSALLFRGEVYAWDDTNRDVTGPALYESPPMHTASTGVLQAVTFQTGGVKLTAGAKYILFATISKDYAADVSGGWGTWGFVGTNAYPGGGFFFNNDGGDPSQWATSTWHGTSSDFAFKADFSPADTDLGISGTPADVTTDATGPSGAVVTYAAPTATDEDAPAAACSPASGSTFAIGSTTVSCSASDPDDTNGPVSSSFNVTVEGAPQQLSDLLGAVHGAGPGKSLSAKVSAAQSYLSAGDLSGTCAVLSALSAEVGAQSGKSIPSGTASTLIADAQRIEAVLGC